jgi:hypothetical protein
MGKPPQEARQQPGEVSQLSGQIGFPPDAPSHRPIRKRLVSIGGTTLSVGMAAISGLIVALFIALLIGGNIYRTECFRPDGGYSHGWEFAESIPYLNGAHEGCVNHTLTRYVLGKIGVMSDVAK